jgi:hypothetical protein
MQVDKRSQRRRRSRPQEPGAYQPGFWRLKFPGGDGQEVPTAPPVRQLQVAVAAYNCGAGGVASLDNADARTTHGDYSNDVWERARFYAIDW